MTLCQHKTFDLVTRRDLKKWRCVNTKFPVDLDLVTRRYLKKMALCQHKTPIRSRYRRDLKKWPCVNTKLPFDLPTAVISKNDPVST